MNAKFVTRPIVDGEIATKSRSFTIASISAAVVFLSNLLPTHCTAGDAIFSKDGERVYVIAVGGQKTALREINLSDQTTRTIPLTQLPDQEWLRGIARSDDDRIFCITQKSLFTFDPASRHLTKVKDAPKGGSFWRVAFDPKSRALFVTADGQAGPLLMLKNGRELVSIWVRRHPRISSPVFTADGEFFYSETGDLWSGQIEKGEEEEGGRMYLTADRYAPLAYLETTNGTPSEMGVSDIAVSRDAIYVQLFRMGGSGWGLLLQLPRRPPTKDRTVSGMAEVAEIELGLYKETLQGLKSLGENNRPANLCASPDESRVFYVNGDKDYLITHGQTEELHLRKSDQTNAAVTTPLTTKQNAAPNPVAPPPAANAAPLVGAMTRDDASAVAKREAYAISTRDIDMLAALYADNVDYLDKGLVSSATVRQDFQQYFDRWPVTKWEIVGPINVEPLEASKSKVTFSIAFDVSDPENNRQAVGTAVETRVVALDPAGTVKIVSQREKITDSRKSENRGSSRKKPSRRTGGEKIYNGKPVYPQR